MNLTLAPELVDELAAPLRDGHRSFARRYPGASGERQPVHTVYGGAHLFRADSAAKLGALAERALATWAPDAGAFAAALGIPGDGVFPEVDRRVREKLAAEPVEDFRIDFEDGYGNRPDDEEDGHARSAAREVARGLAEGTLPPFVGIRVKPFSAELYRRSARTLDLFVTTLAGETGGRLPPGFVVTLPKVVRPEQVAFLAGLLHHLEEELGLAGRSLRCEVMVETPQSIFGPRGELHLPRLVEAASGRLAAAHFGTYDYTALLEITAAHQRMDHPACDFAKHVMQVSLAGTGVWLSDGATNVLPVPPHREAEGRPLTDVQADENRRAVHAAWRLHYAHVRHSLEGAFYQGWDLHPAQLPTRYAAVYGFFLEGLEAAARRLANFVEQAARATLVGDVFDDAATGQGLLNYFLRAINCGAVTAEEAQQRTGLNHAELASRSFLEILEGRRPGG